MTGRRADTCPWPPRPDLVPPAPRSSLGVFVYVFGRFVTVVFAAQLNRALRGLRQGHAPAAALAEDALVGDFILLRFAAVSLGGNLLQLLFRIHRHGVCRSCHGVRRLAATGNAGPRQVLARYCPR